MPTTNAPPPSLVKGSKCPTRGTGAAWVADGVTTPTSWNVAPCDNEAAERRKARFFVKPYRADPNREHIATRTTLEPVRPREDIRGAGTLARLSHRPWSGEYRICCECSAPYQQPPAHSGKRVTTKLSARGKRTIADSCAYVLKERGGYDVFLTLTLTPEARARVEKGESIQKQVSRLFDSLQKMYGRGFVPGDFEIKDRKTGKRERRPNTEGIKVPGHSDALDYLWVIENPTNDQGERNPHIHVLLRWRVPRTQFRAWAERIENLWGQGFAKLEKLRAAEAAGHYMAKAAGYLTKGRGENDQGPVRGNRYGVSKSARAPGWVSQHTWAWGIMGNLIRDAREALHRKRAPLVRERDTLRTTLKGIPRHRKRLRRSIALRLKETRCQLEEIGAYTSRLMIVISDRGRLHKFYDWARTKGWQPDQRPDGLWLATWKRQRYLRTKEEELHRRGMCDWNWRNLLLTGAWEREPYAIDPP